MDFDKLTDDQLKALLVHAERELEGRKHRRIKILAERVASLIREDYSVDDKDAIDNIFARANDILFSTAMAEPVPLSSVSSPVDQAA